MEFFKINAKNHELNVVFTGDKYVFFNAWCGIAAIAERVTPFDIASQTNCETFKILWGNEHLVGGSIGYKGIIPYVKRLVNKCENQYIKKEVGYVDEKVPLERYYATLNVAERK